MIIVTLFALFMAGFCILMVVNPDYFANSIIRFSQLAYFHLFELASRIIIGILFVYYAEETLQPGFISLLGYLFIAVGIGLAITPPSLHKQFAVWSAQKFSSIFRYIGLLGIVFAGWLLWLALAKSLTGRF